MKSTQSYLKSYERWTKSVQVSEEMKSELYEIREDDRAIRDRFYIPLNFGTAGLRGIMGAGINRMNIHTVKQTTQAIANVIRSRGEAQMKRGVVICFDCRKDSEYFAKSAACVFAGNGIPAFLFDALRPTPELSFAIRKQNCVSGINITASHNPKEYNGYKVYGENGAQLGAEDAKRVAQEMEGVDIFEGVIELSFESGIEKNLIRIIGEDIDEAFLSHVKAMAIDPKCVDLVADELKIVYTPFHGAGHKLVPEALLRAGVKHIFTVPEQMVIDGAFPTVLSPNPENEEGFLMALNLAEQKNADLIIGTDPDCDRVGMMARTKDGEYKVLTGNQIGILLTDYIVKSRKAHGTLPKNPAVIRTIVSTRTVDEICAKNGVSLFETFTGFKYIAEKADELQKDNAHEYIFAFEESNGYMTGNYVRDKDAVTASMLLAECAAYYKTRGITLYDALTGIYKEYGYFEEKTINLSMPGLSGLSDMQKLMKDLHENPPKKIAGVETRAMRDYLSGMIYDLTGGEAPKKMPLSGSDVLQFSMADGTQLLIRPSGTEPKIKIYVLANGDTSASPFFKEDFGLSALS